MDIIGDGDEPPESRVTVDGCDAINDACAAYLQQNTLEVLKLLHLLETELAIRVVDDAAMIKLHESHSSETGTTDVLTFVHSVNGGVISADIAICSCVAERSASTRGHSFQDELLLYIVHGILHCLGFDDHDEESYKVMHTEEDRILTAIGIGNVWSNEQ